jgi:hypothetical protein
MTLDENVVDILRKKRGAFLVVDDRCDYTNQDIQREKFYLDHMANEEDVEFFGRDQGIHLSIQDTSHAEIQGKSEGRQIIESDFHNGGENTTILISSNVEEGRPLQLGDFAESAATLSRLKEMAPNANIYYFIPKTTSPTANRALVNQLRLIYGLNGEVSILDFEKYPTLMHLLAEKVTGKAKGVPEPNLSIEQHRYKNEMWKDVYLPHIDDSLKAGNGQTSIDYHFLILSDREMENLGNNEPSADEKVVVKGNDYTLQQEDLEKCAAIFIDNEWDEKIHSRALGSGIETLKRVRKQLDERGINIPIIYQSGHNQNNFSDEEKQEIKSLGAVLGTKNLFPKIHRGKAKAEKEIEISDLVRTNKELSPYIAKIQKLGQDTYMSNDSETFLIATDFVQGNMEGNIYEHRMGVLAMLHTALKEQLNNPIFEPNVPQFMDYDELDGCLKLDGKYKTKYNEIVSNEQHNTKRTISHNDAKEDNWFGGFVLGDFANAAPGTEYKDIARSLLDEKDGFILAKNKSEVSRYIDSYIISRSEKDEEFREEADQEGFKETFKERVYEAMFTESLRIGSFKEIREQGKDIVDQYLSVAEVYST